MSFIVYVLCRVSRSLLLILDSVRMTQLKKQNTIFQILYIFKPIKKFCGDIAIDISPIEAEQLEKIFKANFKENYCKN